MRPPADVLGSYPANLADGVEYLADAGGLSGARLWRLTGGLDTWCLKAWPPETSSPEQLRFAHRLMSQARAAGLAFVPCVLPTLAGATFLESADLLWDVVSWQPGQPGDALSTA